MSDMIFRLKVTLDEIRPPIWRRIDMPSDITLARLHLAFQAAMGWQEAHLHEFRIDGGEYGEPDAEWDDGRDHRSDRRYRLDTVASVGSRFSYIYDFGDYWVHRVVVEKALPPEPGVRYPRVVTGKRACPPEDVGSVPGYYDFVDATADPAHLRARVDDRLIWRSVRSRMVRPGCHQRRPRGEVQGHAVATPRPRAPGPARAGAKLYGR